MYPHFGPIKNPNSEKREVLFEKHNEYTCRNALYKKWYTSKLFEGLKGYQKSNIAQLLESQASSLLNDHSDYRRTYNVPVGVSSRGFGEKTKTAKNYQRPNRVYVEETFISKIKSFFVSLWRKIFKKKDEPNFNGALLPLVRQVAARTMALDLVSVQPLSLPSGMMYYLDTLEREDVYTSKVLIEKYKPYIPSSYSELSHHQDYFIPVRENQITMEFEVDRYDGSAGRWF